MLHNDPRIEAPTATPRTITRSGLQDEHRPRHHTAATRGRRHDLRLLLRRRPPPSTLIQPRTRLLMRHLAACRRSGRRGPIGQAGIDLGDRIEVLGREPFGGSVVIRVGEPKQGRVHGFGYGLAEVLSIELDRDGGAS